VNPWGVPRREVPQAGVTLTSLLDVLVILVVFLLAFLGPTRDAPRLAEDLVLPRSTAASPPGDGVHVRVTRDALSVDGGPVLRLVEGPAGPAIPADLKEGRLVPILEERLTAARANGGAGRPVLLEGDQDLSFAVLREVMYTARRAGFQDCHFLVLGTAPEHPPGGVPR